MATILRMPEVLANAKEAVVSAWAIAEGTEFAIGDTIAEVETEKALVDLPAEQSGILGRILAQPGETTEVGAPIAVLIARGETDADIDAALGSVAAGDPQKVSVPRPAIEEPSVQGHPVEGSFAASEPPVAEVVVSEATRLFASPIARKRARELGIDLTALVGTGPNGRIVRTDVEARASTPAQPAAESAPSAAPDGANYVDIPLTPMRRAIARRLTESKSTVPHFYLTTDCRVDDLLVLRAKVNETSAVKISVNDFVIKAIAGAFADVPEANVTWTGTHLRQWKSVDIAVAVATDTGLLTPVLRGVESMSLSTIAASVAELAANARSGRTRQAELEGGSFSVSNLGMYGTLEFSAILNPPQSGILAVGAARQQPVVVEGELRVATLMRCTLSADHRAVDGALAARWLSAFTRRMENPLSMLI